ncbi:MAG: hypothetical protein U1E02_35285 [Hydrogenophaga sp.]|jgi:hypothetical protein|uniref:hypothetical protein n=2 Tax=Hydrogenophaga sp. TaxID=1904254 RepID=UPI002725D1E8|nr:hypothetical protein [Hydrogenophaga sp.]MDO8887762.1 hypothetical protein [Hydrogenophaga sp.]MDP1782389.1 hypothetical protein [Hydrogenophaga sp.]MDP2251062.1 hypothetical protein [Hydrogenophaga sp.]MDZ4129397.1 hypothetical protein [Hydrogenophaga sp.]
MYERLKNALSPNTWLRSRSAPLAQWAEEHTLSFAPMVGGTYLLAGKWQGRAVRIQCLAPSRPFIQGMELMARADLGLRPEGNVVVMNRGLKEVLEAQSRALYSQYTDELRTMAGVVPDEVRWLSMYRDAGWVGPDHRFWSRYAVLTDAPELARRWIDNDAVQQLMKWPDEVSIGTPMMFMLQRGKTYMRLQVDHTSDTTTAIHALDLFNRLSQRAMDMAAG